MAFWGQNKNRRTAVLCLLLGLGLTGNQAFGEPAWVDDGQKRIGDQFIVVCHGEGLSLDLARNAAIKGCKGTAASQVIDTTQVKTLSVETESDHAFHQEVRQNHYVDGLRCDPHEEEIAKSDETFSVWLKCRFDLGKVETRTVPEPEQSDDDRSENMANVRRSMRDSRPARKPGGGYVRSEKRLLTISTIPKCDSLLIRGSRPRVEQCDENPITVVVSPGDEEIIVRADGREPETIDLSVNDSSRDEAVTVFFD